MRVFFIHVLPVVIGLLLFASVLVFEIDGMKGFLMVTIGVFLIGIGLTLKVIIRLIMEFLSP